MKGGERSSTFFPQKNRLKVEVVRTSVAKKSDLQKCLSYRLLSSHHYKCIQQQALEEKNLLCFRSAKMAFPDGTGTAEPSCWTLVLTQCPNRKKKKKKVALDRLSAFHKSSSNITHSSIASQERSACALHSVHSTLPYPVTSLYWALFWQRCHGKHGAHVHRKSICLVTWVWTHIHA